MLVNGMVYGLGFTTPSLTQTSTECDSWSMMSSLPNPELQVCVGIGYQYVCGFHSTGQDLYKSELACNNSVYIWNDAVNIFEDGRSQKSPKVRALSTMRPKNIQAWKQRGSWRNFGTGKKTGQKTVAQRRRGVDIFRASRRHPFRWFRWPLTAWRLYCWSLRMKKMKRMVDHRFSDEERHVMIIYTS